jgi:hypothetical protein
VLKLGVSDRDDRAKEVVARKIISLAKQASATPQDFATARQAHSIKTTPLRPEPLLGRETVRLVLVAK